MHRNDVLIALAATLVAIALCVHLFWVCMVGDPRYPSELSVSEVAFSMIAFLPALAVALAAPFRRTQLIILAGLVPIAILEWGEGIIPTSQLNHEGSDLFFLLIHFAYFCLSLALILLRIGVAAWHWWRRRQAAAR